MRRSVVIEEEKESPISLKDIPESTPIFATKNGKLAGMIVDEAKFREEESKWSLRIGGRTHSCGKFKSRQACVESAKHYGYEFFIEE